MEDKMRVISDWKKRPRKCELKYDEKMVEAISGNRTRHVKVKNSGEVVAFYEPKSTKNNFKDQEKENLWKTN